MQLLQGKSAPVLDNMKQERQRQRDQMLGQLREQYGPGAETSTAGQQAMQKFDQQTSLMLDQAQQQYLSQVSGIGFQGASTLGQTLSQVNSTIANIGEGYGQMGRDKANIYSAFTGAAGNAEQSLVGSAGAGSMGEYKLGQAVSSLGQNISTGYGNYAGSQTGGTTQQSPGTLESNMSGTSGYSTGMAPQVSSTSRKLGF